MNTGYRYIFEKGSKKHLCPECEKKSFVKYVDSENGKYLPKQYGRCDRESKCGYYLLPPLETRCFFVPFDTFRDISDKAIKINQGSKKQVVPKKTIFEQLQNGIYVAEYFLEDYGVKRNTPLNIVYSKSDYKYYKGNEVSFVSVRKNKVKTEPKIRRSFIPAEVLKKTLSGYEQNVFIQNLLSNIEYPFEVQDVEKVISLYQLGTIQNSYRKGAITFPFIDTNNNIRAIQVKQFDQKNHTTGTDFLHSIIEKHHTRNNKPLPEWLEAYNKNEIKVSCLFGSHNLKKYPYNPIALVEAPKTAVYGTLYFGFPDQPTNMLWLAVYNLSSLTLDKCKALEGRQVYLFPDLSKGGNAYELWSKKAAEFQKQMRGTYFHVSDLLEQLAPIYDREEGKDIADYLIQHDWRLFRSEKSEKSEALEKTLFNQYLNSLHYDNGALVSKNGYPITWDLFGNDVNEQTKGFIRTIEQNPRLMQNQ